MNALRRLVRVVVARRVGALILAALVLLPVFYSPQRMLAGTTFAYLFVIDVSESMNVRDVDTDAPGRSPSASEAMDGRERPPGRSPSASEAMDGRERPPTQSRLDRAKAAVIAALAALPCGSRVAVGLFAGSDTLVLFETLEVCRHYPAIEQVVAGIDWRMAWDGDSRVEAGVVNALHEAGNRGLDLVFLSDGDEAPHVAVPHMGELLALQGKVKGWLVGIGSQQSSPVPHLDADNKIIGYWTAVDAVREGFYPNLSELVKQAASPAELERSGALDEVREHKSALNEDYLKLVGASAALGYVKADSTARVAAAISDATTARHEPAERDMRIVFGLAAALLVMVGWLRKTGVE